MDNRAGMAAAATYPVGLGYQSMGCISRPVITSTSRERLEGFEPALRRHWLRYDGHVFIDGKDHVKISRAGMKLLLSRDIRPSTVCTFNALIALGALQVLKEHRLRVPFDDIQAAAFVTPALTTGHQPLLEIGATAARLPSGWLHRRRC